MKRLEFNGNKNIIFARMRTRRSELGLTQAELAARLQTMNVNIDQQMISKIENNTRIVTDYELACICKVLKVDEKYLLGDFDGSMV